MAVGQARTTRSRRNQRRSHDKISKPSLSIDQESGETHLRHHVSPTGFYRGRQVIAEEVMQDDVQGDEK